MIKLYPHQSQFVDNLRTALRSHQAVLAQASTGFGKTVIAAYIAKSVIGKGKRILFTVHRKDLLTQTALTFDQFKIPYGFIAAGRRQDPFAPVQIATMQTLHNRLHKVARPDFLLVDEARLSAAEGQKGTVLYYKSQGIPLVGLDATPWRLSGEGLDDIYDIMVSGPGPAWLIKHGYLSDYKIYAPSSPDLEGVHSRGGDYVISELEKVMNTNTTTGCAIKHYRKLAPNTRALAFCCSVKHSKAVSEHFKSEGIMAMHIDGETPQEDRMRAFVAFAARDIQIITSCQIFAEGFDLSAQVGQEVPVETIISLRSTQSLSLWLQHCGRGLRRKPYPCIILDHAGNTMRHGLPDDEREWTLEGRKHSKASTPAEVSVRQCPECFFVHKIAAVCPECGKVYEVVGRLPEEVEGELQELDKTKIRQRAKYEQSKARSLDDLIALGKRRNMRHPHGWAAYVWTSREAKRRAKG